MKTLHEMLQEYLDSFDRSITPDEEEAIKKCFFAGILAHVIVADQAGEVLIRTGNLIEARNTALAVDREIAELAKEICDREPRRIN